MHETEVAHITDACDVFTDFVGFGTGFAISVPGF